MNVFRINTAGLSYIADQLAEITGKTPQADSAAVAAYAQDAEASADSNGSAAAAQFEVRGMHSLSGRPEIVSLSAEHVEGTVQSIAASVAAAGFAPFDITDWQPNVDAGFSVSSRVSVSVSANSMHVTTTDGEGDDVEFSFGEERSLSDTAGLLADIRAAL